MTDEPDDEKQTAISLQLPQGLADRVRALAREESRSQSSVVRQALKEWFQMRDAKESADASS
jgi:predicted transcriptional regulator